MQGGNLLGTYILDRVKMAHVQYMDEMIREYLLFRGFTATVKAFDSDLKIDKEKGFRVDKIIDQLWHFINSYDLNALRELWGHLDTHMFAKLESNFTTGQCAEKISCFYF